MQKKETENTCIDSYSRLMGISYPKDVGSKGKETLAGFFLDLKILLLQNLLSQLFIFILLFNLPKYQVYLAKLSLLLLKGERNPKGLCIGFCFGASPCSPNKKTESFSVPKNLKKVWQMTLLWFEEVDKITSLHNAKLQKGLVFRGQDKEHQRPEQKKKKKIAWSVVGAPRVLLRTAMGQNWLCEWISFKKTRRAEEQKIESARMSQRSDAKGCSGLLPLDWPLRSEPDWLDYHDLPAACSPHFHTALTSKRSSRLYFKYNVNLYV